jgi:hypothetical protein
MERRSVSGFGNQAFGAFTFGAGFADPTTPNLTDFTNWVYASMEVPVEALPVGSAWLQYAFAQAMALVPCIPCIPAITYVLAVYNCGGHLLLKIAIDQDGQEFFKCLRASLKMGDTVNGVIQSSGDQNSSNSFAIGQGMQNMTMSDLGFYRTPWGREYLSYIQDLGPTIWGLS